MFFVLTKDSNENNAFTKFSYKSFYVLTDRLEIKNFQSWGFQ